MEEENFLIFSCDHIILVPLWWLEVIGKTFFTKGCCFYYRNLTFWSISIDATVARPRMWIESGSKSADPRI